MADVETEVAVVAGIGFLAFICNPAFWITCIVISILLCCCCCCCCCRGKDKLVIMQTPQQVSMNYAPSVSVQPESGYSAPPPGYSSAYPPPNTSSPYNQGPPSQSAPPYTLLQNSDK